MKLWTFASYSVDLIDSEKIWSLPKQAFKAMKRLKLRIIQVNSRTESVRKKFQFVLSNLLKLKNFECVQVIS